jgi:large subunit ribosomal protein L15e
MVKSVYSYVAEAWKNLDSSVMKELMRERYVGWRRAPTVVRIDKPTRLDRARAIGYEAKQGFVVARVRVKKGGLSRPRPNSGRRPKRMGIYGYAPEKP